MQGFITLHRKMLEWEWFTDINTSHVFLYCLLKANFETKKWRGINIKRGSFITSLEHISKDTGLTVRQVRTALDKLKSTGELTSQSTSQYSIISIKNYNLYQDYDKQIDKRMTSERQTNDKRATTTNNDNNNNNDNNDNNEEEVVEVEEEKSKNSCNFYGEFGNVYISPKNYDKLTAYILNNTILAELIEELSAKISKKSDRYKPYDPDYPDAHYLHLMDFWKFRKNNPAKFMTVIDSGGDYANRIDNIMQELKRKDCCK